LRALWGIGRTKEMVKKIAQILDDESNSSIDTEEYIQESQDLENEAEQASQHGSATGLTEDFNDMDATSGIAYNMSCFLLLVIVHPETWGKLKAHELLILFTVILPLVIPELWWRGNETEIRRLQSFCDLVVATNVICAYSTSNVEADIYMDHFVKYRVSIQELYPGFSSMPNHHYAMHGGDQLKFWGPLALLSDMELTMVQKSACKGRLEGLLHDNQFTNPATQKLAKILEPRDIFAFMSTPETMTGSQIAKALSDGEPLSKTHYAILLKYLNNSGREYKSAYTNSRYPSGTLILPTRAKCHSQIPFNNTTFSCTKSHEGQSHIQFYIPGGFGGTWETGYIEAIWELPLEGIKECFLL
ncbi:hypothetical protein F5879DRAFT_928107, partial [Lentinula edodes]